MPEEIPTWAQGLLKEVTTISERLRNLVDTTNAKLEDHEGRLRVQEQTSVQIASALERVTKVEENQTEVFTRLRSVERRVIQAISIGSFLLLGLGVWANLVQVGIIK
jgi:glutamine synthetase adenylyltransferase